MITFNFPYLLFFIPLISSFINQLPSPKKLHSAITIFTLISIILVSLLIMPTIPTGDDLIFKINDKALFLLGEYKIGYANIFFIIIIFATKLMELFRYDKQLLGLEKLKNKRFFYSIYLINCFAIIGILLSNNIFNLFIYLEIYSFTLYAIISNYKNKKLSIVAFKYFLCGVFGSLLIFLAVFGLFIIFRTADISQILSLMNNIPVKQSILLFILFIMFTAGIITKFFSFWIYFSKIKKANTTSNFLYISLVFTNIFLGTYLFLKVIHNLFSNEIYTNFYFTYFFILLGAGLVSCYSYYLIKRNNLFYIALKLSLIDLGYILINLGINNTRALNSTFLLLINHFLINLFLFLIASFLIYNYRNSDISLLKVFHKYRYVILGILGMKLIFPFTVNFASDWNFSLAIFESRQYYLIFPFILNKIAIINLIGKAHSSFAIGILREKLSYNEKNTANKNYKFAFICLSCLIVLSIFYSPFIQDFINNLSTHLLNK
jgi:multicomponent Na+:H+ antiporter subunit D